MQEKSVTVRRKNLWRGDLACCPEIDGLRATQSLCLATPRPSSDTQQPWCINQREIEAATSAHSPLPKLPLAACMLEPERIFCGRAQDVWNVRRTRQRYLNRCVGGAAYAFSPPPPPHTHTHKDTCAIIKDTSSALLMRMPWCSTAPDDGCLCGWPEH